MRRSSWLLAAALLAVVTFLADSSHAQRKPRPGPAHPGPIQVPESADATEPTLTMTLPVACSEIRGYEDFQILPDAALTSDEKLLVYYRPLNYHTEHTGATYHIHLVQDGQVRRRGQKAVLLFKTKMVDYDWKSQQPDNPVYIRNTFSLKGLKPGEYDFDIILRDMLAPGEPVTKQTLEFQVIPAALPVEPNQPRKEGS